jgi:hypothetical protein
VIWYLVAFGILLIVVGVWGGPRRRQRPDKTNRIPREATVQEAWDILVSPVEYDEELIKIPEHRPWYLPGRDRRFQQGLFVGLGAGVLAMALIVNFTGGMWLQGPAPGQVAAGDEQQPGGSTEPEPPANPTEPGAVTNPEVPENPGTPENPGAPENPEVPAPPEAPAEPATPAAPPSEITVVIEPGSVSGDIAAALKEAGLITDEQAFLDRVGELGVETYLQAGTFIFPSGATLDEIIAGLTA